MQNNLMPTTFSLRELRARKHKTQRQVATDLGISVATYNTWEKDLSKIAIGKVLVVAQYFGVSVEQICLTPESNSCI